MNKKKVIITAGIILAVIIIIVVGIIIAGQLKRNYTLEEVTQFNYATIQKEGKYGVIDMNGNVLVEPTYDSIKIPNPSKPVFICIYDYDNETGKYKTKALNDKQEELFKEYEEINAIQIKEIVSSVPYEKSVLKVKKDGKYGLIDFTGKVVVDPMYDELDNIAYKEGELVVKKDDKYGVINIKGVTLVDIKYDSIEGDNYYSNEKEYHLGGYIVGNKTDEGFRYGYINSKGKVLLKTQYNKIYRMTEIQDDKNVYLVAEKSGLAGLLKNKKELLKNEYQSIEYDELNKVFTIEKNKQFGVVDINGKTILPVEYDGIIIEGVYIYANKGQDTTVFDINGNKQDNLKYKTVISANNTDYRITIDDEDHYGIENKEGNKLVPNDYLYMEYAFGDYFIACGLDNKLGIINTKNEKIVDLKYDVVQKLDDTNMIQASILSTDTLELYNEQMQQIASMEGGKLVATKEYVKVYSDQDAKYFDLQGQEKKNTQIFSNNILFAAQQNGKWGFVDKDGNKKVDYTYDKVTEFNTHGFAGIKKDGKWGVMNKEGNVILEPAYTIEDRLGEPDFIGKYYKVVSGYGETYYTDELKVEQTEE